MKVKVRIPVYVNRDGSWSVPDTTSSAAHVDDDWVDETQHDERLYFVSAELESPADVAPEEVTGQVVS